MSFQRRSNRANKISQARISSLSPIECHMQFTSSHILKRHLPASFPFGRAPKHKRYKKEEVDKLRNQRGNVRFRE